MVLEKAYNGIELRRKLRANTIKIRRGLAAAGFNVMGVEEVPMIPVLIGESDKAVGLQHELLKHCKIFVIAIP